MVRKSYSRRNRRNDDMAVREYTLNSIWNKIDCHDILTRKAETIEQYNKRIALEDIHYMVKTLGADVVEYYLHLFSDKKLDYFLILSSYK